MCKTEKNKINLLNLFGLLGEKLLSKVLQGAKLKKME